MTTYRYTLGIVALITLCACENLFFESDQASTDPQENFDALWKACDEKYSYFDVKNIDWDEVKHQQQTKLYDGMSEDSLFNVLAEMLTILRDDHTNLISNFNVSFYGVSNLGPDNFDWRIIEDNYLSDNHYITGPFIHDFIANNEIAYVRLSSFTGTIDETNLDFILERYNGTKGMIIDLRENGGGAATDIFTLLSRFVEERTLLYYSKIRNGPSHDDFSETVPTYIDPHNGLRYKQNVAILTDRGTYSAGSFTSLATKALANIQLIGDTTGGGLGLPNGGQLPNGWTYRFSITQALTLDMNPDYENGVPPDVPVLFDWSNLTTDEVIERAITELLEQ